mmetsp:Transcript_989/g.3550  ORF Transcript_989/g.3550 Transcript_989/m.3550 type:complete len:211 (-) Transcript_989:690-1322(-)
MSAYVSVVAGARSAAAASRCGSVPRYCSIRRFDSSSTVSMPAAPPGTCDASTTPTTNALQTSLCAPRAAQTIVAASERTKSRASVEASTTPSRPSRPTPPPAAYGKTQSARGSKSSIFVALSAPLSESTKSVRSPRASTSTWPGAVKRAVSMAWMGSPMLKLQSGTATRRAVMPLAPASSSASGALGESGGSLYASDPAASADAARTWYL